jgi:predicted DNA-binding protein (MmcQ/YjbR family)
VLEHPFGDEADVYKVGGKIFAVLSTGRLTLKAEPERAAALRDEHPEITPGYHMDKRHWISVDPEAALPDGLLGELVEDAYDVVRASLPKRVQAELPPL